MHSDIWDPAPLLSKQGFIYYIIFVDDQTRYTWIYPLKAKNEALSTFIQFKNQAEKQFERNIKTLHTDSGTEFKMFQNFVKKNGIVHLFTCPYTYAQNGRAERKHRHITESGLTFLAQASMPLEFWWEAFHCAVYLINRLPTPLLVNKSPLQLLFGKIPDYKSLHPFGCTVFPCLTPYNNQKFQFHSTKCIFIGYSDAHKG